MSRHFYAPPTPFIGRAVELKRLDALLHEAEIPLISILGPGGIGKTRLAVAAAEQNLDDFAGQVYVVPLQPLSNWAQLPLAIAEVIGFTYYHAAAAAEQLFAHLQDKRMLLVLDNFDHLIDGTGFVGDLLAAAPDLKLLVTSREKLNLRGEAAFVLDGLPLAKWEDVDSALQADAVRLFMLGAQRADTEFTLTPENLAGVSRICHLVDGTPLGIELAAAWVDVLAPEEIADEIEHSVKFLEVELRDMPARHRSLRATFESSWNLLTDEQRSSLQSLAVFPGGFTREAAETVTGAGLRMLQALMNKSLLRRLENGRYELHQLLRQFAEEHLSQVGKLDTLRQGHTHYYLDRLRQLEPDLKGGGQLEALSEISADFDNLRSAWAFAVENNLRVELDGALESLFWYCQMHSRYMDAEQLFRSAEARFEQRDGDQGRLLATRIALRRRWLQRWREGAFTRQEDSVSQLEALLALLRRHEAPTEAAICLMMLGDALRGVDGSRTQAYLAEALDYFQATGGEFYAAWALHFLARAAAKTSGIASAIDLHRRSLALRQQRNDASGASYSQHNLSVDLLLMGQFDQSLQLAQQVYESGQATGERSGELMANTTRCLITLLRGDLAIAAALSAENLRAASQISHPLGRAFAMITQGIGAAIEGESAAAQFLLKDAEHFTEQDIARFFTHWGRALALAETDHADFAAGLSHALRYARNVRGTGALIWCLLVGGVWLARRGDLSRAAHLLGLASHEATGGWAAQWQAYREASAVVEGRLNRDEMEQAEGYEFAANLEALADDLLRLLGQSDVETTFPLEVVAANEALADPLSLRELEVLALIAAGLSNQEIADQLVVGVSTVKKHITHIYGKLAVDSRTQVILRAQALGLV